LKDYFDYTYTFRHQIKMIITPLKFPNLGA
jgi:hypothetical protein